MQARDEVEHNYKWVSSWSLLCGKEMLKAGRTLLFLNLVHTWSELIILFQQGYGCTYLVFCMLPFLLNFKALAKQLCIRERKGYLFNNFNGSGQCSLIINYLGSSCRYCFKWHFFSPCLFRTMSTKLEKVMKELDSEVIVVLNNGIVWPCIIEYLWTVHLTTLVVANSHFQWFLPGLLLWPCLMTYYSAT